MLLQSMIEEVITMGVVMLLVTLGVNFIMLGHIEDVKLKSLTMNVEAAKELKQAFYETGDETVFDFSLATDGYITEVKSFESVDDGLYRVVIGTSHKGKEAPGTEVVIYAVDADIR